MTTSTKNLLIKTVVSCLLLAYLLWTTDLHSVWDAFKTASPFWLGAAFSLHIIGFLLSAYRWQMLLAVRGAHYSVGYLLQSLMIGIFFNSFLPSTVGGDVFRAYDTSERAGSTTEAMTVVVVERLTGMFALGLFALFALLFEFSQFSHLPIIWLSLGGLGIAFLCFVAAMQPRIADVVKKVFQHPVVQRIPFSQKIRTKLRQIYHALAVYRRNRRVMGIAFALALVLQINVIFHYYTIAYAMNLQVSVFYFFLIVPVVTIILMLPLFINGIGGRELVYIFLFGQFGVPRADAIAFSWISFGMVLIQGVIGGMLYAIRKKEIPSS
ncbi:integral membrane protein [Candidatus Moduliflexus flocculans]|uniref:Integral membrane protein n=1 Tax=Candidatus Moduliflexus flocculans TaxID=1499966 RepID=A0A081BPF3_9BACT|nr:integral membrane protein [Candidatus Moduliflexus flocculans]